MIHVVIPVYNAEKYLQEAVDSVLNQPFKGIDIVLVDDGSTDGSLALCDTIAAKEERVTVIHQKNAGVSAARNTGIEFFLDRDNLENAMLMFLDSDDLWARGFFTPEMYDCISQETDVDVFCFESCECNEKRTLFSYPNRYEASLLEGGNGVIWKINGHFCANIYRLSLIRKWNIRFAPNLKYSEDKIFMLQCAFLARYVRFLPLMLHIHRENDYSAMKKFFSINPIDYYIPIINEWVASDRFLNGYSAQSGRTTNAGVTLAGIYFMDMAQEHFERWHRLSQLNDVFCSNPYYHLFVQMDPKCVRPKQYADHNLLLEHPRRFRLRCYAIGAVKLCARMGLSVKPIRKLRNRKKYPLEQI